MDAGDLTSSLSLEAQQQLKAILLTHQQVSPTHKVTEALTCLIGQNNRAECCLPVAG